MSNKSDSFVTRLESLFPGAKFSALGTNKVVIHAGSEINGLPAFNMRRLGFYDKDYEFGINRRLMEELWEAGYYYSDASGSGDMICRPVSAPRKGERDEPVL